MADDNPSGFDDVEDDIVTASMGPPKDRVRLGESISPTSILIEIEREGEGATKDASASIEIVNLCEHEAGDAYDAENRELDYSELDRELKLRVDALINHTRFDGPRCEHEGEDDADVLKRYHGQGDE
ncbi:hypothetical protein C464_08140 [Halorubrum coriense DSM 10284]|uniref:Uncharacterized protein n=1 Tax=Halorubrum coriense DSM 10284 TaxID=1227466 RepID=M0EJB7_9EURY|nr:hypothetical protein [Halorubrum coriense]ELZ47876.1 hypothetical protein C464_08140 [Halorubrum coriense DSM 10284]